MSRHWKHIRYVGRIFCPRCWKWGYADWGRIGKENFTKISHRKHTKEGMKYEGLCYWKGHLKV